MYAVIPSLPLRRIERRVFERREQIDVAELEKWPGSWRAELEFYTQNDSNIQLRRQ